MKKDSLAAPLFLAFLVFLSAWLSSSFCQRADAAFLTEAVPECDEFRSMQLSERMLPKLRALEEGTSMATGELLTVLLPFTGFRFFDDAGMDAPELIRWKGIFLRCNRPGFLRLSKAFGAVWDDVRCLPYDGGTFAFENSWMFERTYGGPRGHEGTDLMPPENIPGHYPVVSMTDGMVESVGWLEKGGYRIGIRSPSGGYFYYAHLDSYARKFLPGETVQAGEVLGRVGDTGYGPEGTRGKFDVHLHLGIYIRTQKTQELSVNPYWVLRYLEYIKGLRRS